VLRQIRGGSLGLLLFIVSLLIGRLTTGAPSPISPGDGQLPTSTPTAPSPTATIVPTPTWTVVPSWTSTPPPTPTVQLRGTVILDQDNVTAYSFAAGSFIHPLRMVVRGDDVYLLDKGQLKLMSLSAEPSSQVISPPDNAVEGVMMQELADIALAENKSSLLLLDRAGSLFRYFPDDESWQLERSVTMPGVSSRQDCLRELPLAVDISQFWQCLQWKLQPSVPIEKHNVPG